MLINQFTLLTIEFPGVRLRESFEGIENRHADGGESVFEVFEVGGHGRIVTKNWLAEAVKLIEKLHPTA